ncbi:hypothetical protein [Pelagibius sp. Alg239-R121]|uniref:hypothetical protein n=1 Tax=Pelagibius sp. Alg239-R121 TaxID=2993448 RepID=UPI0024A6166B|nr:hypothetical protein [Pelagibius sp. Alg239-R121]
MQIVVEDREFRRLKPETQQELLSVLTGKRGPAAQPSPSTRQLKWRQPVDLRPEQAMKFVHGLSADQRRRLELFAKKGGRVRMREIMDLSGDTDLRAVSEFQKLMTRRLRRIIDDPEKKAQLIGWDFNATKWDDKRTTIVDGVYYVTETTAASLRQCMKEPA